MESNVTSNKSFSILTDTSKVLWIVAFSLQFLSALIGNLLILTIVYKDNRLKTTTNYIVANMAVSDVLSSISLFPKIIISVAFGKEWMISGDSGNLLCKISTFLENVSWTVSLYSFLLIAFDRYFAVSHPLKKPYQNRIKYINIGVWIWSVVLKAPNLYFFGILDDGKQWLCTVSPKPYSFVHSIVSSAFTGAVVGIGAIIAYALTVYKLYTRRVPGVQNDRTRTRREQQNKKALKMSASIVTLGYLTCGWWFVFVVLKYLGKLDHLSPSTLKNVSNTSYFIAYMFYVYNFYLYLIFNDIYRKNIKIMLTKCSCTFYAVDGSSTSNTGIPTDTGRIPAENQVTTEC